MAQIQKARMNTNEQLIYRRAYEQLFGIAQQSQAFKEFLELFPEDDIEARNFLLKAYAASNTGRSSYESDRQTGVFEFHETMPPVLSNRVLDSLKKENPALYQRINEVYQEFNRKRAGFGE